MALKKRVLFINGVERMFVADNDKDTLAEALRRLGLTSVKVGCGTGVCGACSVILDGEVTRACIKKLAKVDDYSEVITLEGIGTPTNLHPLQQAWITRGGVQCGFCTPGFIVSAYQLLRVNPDPTRQEVRDWFQKYRNACRCTGYQPLVDAVIDAAKVMRGDAPASSLEFDVPADGSIYGTDYPRPAALGKVTGTTDFGKDLIEKMPEETLHLAMVQSDLYRAKVVSRDYSEALASEGVVQVVDYKDVKGTNRIFFPDGSLRNRAPMNSRPIFVEDMIYRPGDCVCVVAADTREHARAAAEKVKIEYVELPAYKNVLEACAADADQIHANVKTDHDIPNIYMDFPVLKGDDPRDIFDNADFVVEDSYSSQRQPHLVIEPDVAFAYTDDTGCINVHTKSLAIGMAIVFSWEGLGFPPPPDVFGMLREIENPTGASFGYSLSQGTFCILVVATQATGKPVAIELSYAEHQKWSGKRSESYTNLKMACDKEGKILAEEFEIAYDKGAYDETSDVSTKGNRFMGAPYSIPSVRGVSKGVFTNTAFSTAFRGYGSPQVYSASEQMIDQLAETAGIDPLEFRYINVCRPGDTSINSHTYDCYPMEGLIDKMRPHYEVAKKRVADWNATNSGPIRRGVGVSSAHYNVCGGPNDESVMAMELRPDGIINVYSGWEDQGQGGDIGTLIHAHESLRKAGFDITPEEIHLIMNDTALSPPAGPAAASRSNYMNGRSLENAAQNLAATLKKEDGTFRTYAEAVADGVDTKVVGVYSTAGFTFPIDDNTGQAEGDGPCPTYTYGVYVSEVEVDTTTGKTTVLSMHCATDVGTVTSVQGLIGQALGGMQQSLGFALSEDYQDHNKDVNLVKCGFPYINDVPDDLDVILQETPRATGAHGAGGASEVYLSGGHVSILNAIYNAVGVRVKNLPATPDKVLALLKLKEEGKEPAKLKYNFGIDLYDDLDWMAANPEYRDPEEAVGPAL